ncbi:MAG TPA: hypothetical protein VHY18_06385 [Solirubrobacteraceae bacterium]|jgi:hypothetical protein|nr:hypothetical protein [Solirubrobacteraceae bacterium]
MALASSVFAASALAVAPPPPPAASTGGVSSVTPSSAVLHGSLDAKAQPTNYVFQYGTTKFYGGQTPLAPGGRAPSTIQVSQAIGGLQADTIYHYRILAIGVRVATPGVDRTFKTPKVPLSLQIAGSPNPVPFGDPFAVQGTLTGTGNAGRVVALQTNPFPYVAGFKTLGNFEVTSSTGSFSFPVVGLLTNTQLRVVTTSAPYVTSPVVVEGVAVQVTLHVRRVHRHRRGNFVRFYGTITPAELGAHVGFQLLRSGAPSINQGGTIVTSGTPTVSRFSAIVRIRHRGVYAALVQVFDGSHVSAYSAPIRIG